MIWTSESREISLVVKYFAIELEIMSLSLLGIGSHRKIYTDAHIRNRESNESDKWHFADNFICIKVCTYVCMSENSLNSLIFKGPKIMNFERTTLIIDP